MTEKYINANGIDLAYEEFGDPKDPVMLLIMGLGTQMTGWPVDFCAGLATHGYRVIRFDNRDIGLSQKMDSLPTPRILKVMLFSRLKLPLTLPYTLDDMANDVVGLLDALNIESAHIIGASMGGMIAQLVAGHFPFRVLSLTSIMSTSGRKSLPGPDRKIALHMLRRPAKADAKLMHEHAMRTWRLIGSPAYPPTDEALSEKLSDSYKRSYYPAGHSRQMVAIMAGGDRTRVLKKIVAPTLVIHGKADPLVPVSGGVDTAQLISGATLELVEGMGHDLPDELLPHFIELICSNADKATGHL